MYLSKVNFILTKNGFHELSILLNEKSMYLNGKNGASFFSQNFTKLFQYFKLLHLENIYDFF